MKIRCPRCYHLAEKSNDSMYHCSCGYSSDIYGFYTESEDK